MGGHRFLHPLVEVDLPPFINEFHLEIEVTLNREAFISALACSPCVSSIGPLDMVYELLQNCFVLNDYMNGFDLFFEVCGHIAQGHVPPSTSHLFFYIFIPNVGKVIWRHTSHCD
jgi:hypothetical protein